MQVRLTPHAIALLSFLAFYLVLIIDVRHWSWRDPGSYFFDPEHAFDRVYSLQRESEAETFIHSAAESGAQNGYTKAGSNPSFCVAIPTVQREGARYFRRALGSVLQGLTDTERRDIWVMPFIVNLDPNEHAAFHEPWLQTVSDEVMTYTDAKEEVTAGLKEVMQGDVDNRRKALFDYTHLLRSCYEKNTEWILIAEDDTIAADGWYKRTKDATAALERRGDFDRTVYLRLFYNERLLGWNSEEWFGYLVRVILFEVALFAILLAAAVFLPIVRPVLTPGTIATITFILSPMLIIIYFLAGRLTVAGPSRGINKMNSYGCCSQAFVFPRSQVPDLLAWYEKNAHGYTDPVTHTDRTQIDSLTEIHANENGLVRYALTPSVFQHVGGKSTKPTSVTRWGRSNTENIWNFSFEKLDREKLKREHVG